MELGRIEVKRCLVASEQSRELQINRSWAQGAVEVEDWVTRQKSLFEVLPLSLQIKAASQCQSTSDPLGRSGLFILPDKTSKSKFLIVYDFREQGFPVNEKAAVTLGRGPSGHPGALGCLGGERFALLLACLCLLSQLDTGQDRSPTEVHKNSTLRKAFNKELAFSGLTVPYVVVCFGRLCRAAQTDSFVLGT